MGALLTSLLMFSCFLNEELNGVVSQSEKKDLRGVYARSSEYPRASTASEEDQLRDWLPKLYMSKVMITGPATKEVFARKRELAMQKLSPVEISPAKKNALFVKNRNNSNGNFEKVFAAWVDRWMSPKYAPSSRLEDAKDLPEFSQLLAMGTKILPLVVEKMLDDENLLAVVLYDALQDNKELKVMYVGNEYLKGEQYRMRLSAKKWIDSNL